MNINIFETNQKLIRFSIFISEGLRGAEAYNNGNNANLDIVLQTYPVFHSNTKITKLSPNFANSNYFNNQNCEKHLYNSDKHYVPCHCCRNKMSDASKERLFERQIGGSNTCQRKRIHANESDLNDTVWLDAIEKVNECSRNICKSLNACEHNERIAISDVCNPCTKKSSKSIYADCLSMQFEESTKAKCQHKRLSDVYTAIEDLYGITTEHRSQHQCPNCDPCVKNINKSKTSEYIKANSNDEIRYETKEIDNKCASINFNNDCLKEDPNESCLTECHLAQNTDEELSPISTHCLDIGIEPSYTGLQNCDVKTESMTYNKLQKCDSKRESCSGHKEKTNILPVIPDVLYTLNRICDILIKYEENLEISTSIVKYGCALENRKQNLVNSNKNVNSICKSYPSDHESNGFTTPKTRISGTILEEEQEEITEQILGLEQEEMICTSETGATTKRTTSSLSRDCVNVKVTETSNQPKPNLAGNQFSCTHCGQNYFPCIPFLPICNDPLKCFPLICCSKETHKCQCGEETKKCKQNDIKENSCNYESKDNVVLCYVLNSNLLYLYRLFLATICVLTSY